MNRIIAVCIHTEYTALRTSLIRRDLHLGRKTRYCYCPPVLAGWYLSRGRRNG